MLCFGFSDAPNNEPDLSGQFDFVTSEGMGRT